MGITALLARAVCVVACCLSLIQIALAQAPKTSSTAKDPIEAANLEFALSDSELNALQGQTFDVLLKNGKKESGATLKGFLVGKQLKDRFRSIELTLADQKKSRKYPADQVFQLEREGKVAYLVAYLPTQKYHVLVDVTKRNEVIAKRLDDTGAEIWEEISAEDQAKYVAEEKVFLDKVKTHFSALPLKLVETQYFLFLSDMPPGQLNPYLQQLDKMNESLGQAFGYPPGHNIWRGKAVIVAFMAQSSFEEFEQQFMESAIDSQKAQGLCHPLNNGRVIVSAYRGTDANFFGSLLVHETAHGYVHRYKSSAEIPSWFHEGIADWIAGQVVPACKEVESTQRAAVQRLNETERIGEDFFTATNIDGWQYGVASGMVQLLVQANPSQFQLFFKGTKEGLSWDDSLMRAYGMTRADLVSAYGRAIGVPHLQQ